jgi:4-diphosphocytidyl-2-C-methyl-D-erythritol kinase
MSSTRQARVRALAKINLDLRVLGKRPDGFHELRTVFQTISLGDTLEIAYTPARKTAISLEDDRHIPDNLVVRAARLVMEAMRATGRIEMRLTKRIPMGAGLGGGSSDAAAVLLALPALLGRPFGHSAFGHSASGHIMNLPKLSALGEQLGSDVPFFLLGGTAVGIGRGSEVFPLPDAPSQQGILVAPGIHVDTARAYRDLSPRLTTESQQNKIVSFQSITWDTGSLASARNDFESVVFEQHRKLATLKKRLVTAGASAALMTGSGSALFGLFPDGNGISRAKELLGEVQTFPISLVGRARYRALWRRALKEHTTPGLWPLQSRYSR